MKSSNPHITLIGAGLAGSLLAIYLAKRGFQVDIFEKRGDMRQMQVEAGRSINLALSNRGIRALRDVGIADEVLKTAIPMYGRMLHSLEGELTFVRYGKDDSEYINSISRAGLNIALMDIADSYPNVKIHFHSILEEVNFEKNTFTFKNLLSNQSITKGFSIMIGTDGAGSMLRQAMVNHQLCEDELEFLEHGYKELTIPAKADGSFYIEKNALHIWPRGTYMLIALPNAEGSFTCTLFLPDKGELSFESLDNPEKITAFFKEKFVDAIPLIPDLESEFIQNPVGLLGTVKCFPWHYADKALLMGDAAHAIVPFYGQGMNAAFEDCIFFNQCLEKYGTDWQKVFDEFEKLRKINADAIAELAMENFIEMRDAVAEPAFLLKRQLENILENTYKDYHSKYSMVTFHPEISYLEAHQKGNKQDEILLTICRKVQNIKELEIEKVYQQVKAL